MWGLLLFPRDFEPEDYGWSVANPIVPHQQLQSAVQELHQFGFVSTHYSRWEVPYRSPAGLVRMGYEAGSGRYFGMYLPPFERDRNIFSTTEIDQELRFGTGGGIISPHRPFVSSPTVSGI